MLFILAFKGIPPICILLGYEKVGPKDIRRTVILTGTRRVRKTTIAYQMIDTLIKSGISPAQIVFVSLDYPM